MEILVITRRTVLSGAAAAVAATTVGTGSARAEVVHSGQSLPDPGMNIARYDLGACS
ncbi:twin-arginine translocation signal domain-containing protein [Lentzea flaviverrucosa]|uniref:twin-arginine translocation signal domain-containing protein n=1 Tax=Lentzea flaviverrucosa TaxID=200379 RepID=UPI0011604AF1|nr:twin-arginine translocation signal domain-containing protein [Lentzea flaviverrucosa]